MKKPKKILCYFCKAIIHKGDLAGIFKVRGKTKASCNNVCCLIELSDLIELKK